MILNVTNSPMPRSLTLVQWTGDRPGRGNLRIVGGVHTFDTETQTVIRRAYPADFADPKLTIPKDWKPTAETPIGIAPISLAKKPKTPSLAQCVPDRYDHALIFERGLSPEEIALWREKLPDCIFVSRETEGDENVERLCRAELPGIVSLDTPLALMQVRVGPWLVDGVPVQSYVAGTPDTRERRWIVVHNHYQARGNTADLVVLLREANADEYNTLGCSIITTGGGFITLAELLNVSKPKSLEGPAVPEAIDTAEFETALAGVRMETDLVTGNGHDSRWLTGKRIPRLLKAAEALLAALKGPKP